MCPANERWRYIVTSSPIGWVHTKNDPIYWMAAGLIWIHIYNHIKGIVDLIFSQNRMGVSKSCKETVVKVHNLHYGITKSSQIFKICHGIFFRCLFFWNHNSAYSPLNKMLFCRYYFEMHFLWWFFLHFVFWFKFIEGCSKGAIDKSALVQVMDWCQAMLTQLNDIYMPH